MVHKIKDKEDFDSQLQAAGDKLVVVDFYAIWCGPCKRIAPFLEELQEKHKDKLVILKVDIDENDELASSHKIEVMPTFIFFRSGKHLDKMTGSNEDKLKEAIEKHL